MATNKNNEQTEKNNDKELSMNKAESDGKKTENTVKNKNDKKSTSTAKKSKSSPKGKAKSTKRKKTSEEMRLTNEVRGIILLGVAALLLFFAFTYDSLGYAGIAYKYIILHTFGFCSVVIPFALGYYGYITLKNRDIMFLKFKFTVLICLIASLCSMIHVLRANSTTVAFSYLQHVAYYYLCGDLTNGGFLGALIGGALLKIFTINGKFVIFFIFVLLTLVCCIMLTGKSFVDVISKIKMFVTGIGEEASAAMTYKQNDEETSSKRNRKEEYEDTYSDDYEDDYEAPDDYEENKEQPSFMKKTSEIISMLKNKIFSAKDLSYDDTYNDEDEEIDETESEAVKEEIEEEAATTEEPKNKTSFVPDYESIRRKRAKLEKLQEDAVWSTAPKKRKESAAEQKRRLEALSEVNKREKEYQDMVNTLGVPHFNISDEVESGEDDAVDIEMDFINKNNRIYNPNVGVRVGSMPNLRETVRAAEQKIRMERDGGAKVSDLFEGYDRKKETAKFNTTYAEQEDKAADEAENVADVEMPEVAEERFESVEQPKPQDINEEYDIHEYRAEPENTDSDSEQSAYVVNPMGVYVRSTHKNSEENNLPKYSESAVNTAADDVARSESDATFEETVQNAEMPQQINDYGDIETTNVEKAYKEDTPIYGRSLREVMSSGIENSTSKPVGNFEIEEEVPEYQEEKPNMVHSKEAYSKEAYSTQAETVEDEPVIIEAEKVKTVDVLKTDEEAVGSAKYQFPKIEFLSTNPKIHSMGSRTEIIEKAKKLEATLATFGINAKVNNISQGPAVTRYEITPPQGVRVNKIVSLEDDIMLSLAAKSVRIEAPIPGKSAIGIEIPNDEVTPVYFSEILMTDKFQEFESKLAFGIGKDIAGNVIIADISKMPHLLIAGATGSGKSVCINTLITSILYKATPSEVRLIMVDPKVVELSVYNDIPHLLVPVVTDVHKAAGALRWACTEMDRRYNLFAQTGTRNLAGYNKLMPEGGKLPHIVIIIDELADLMLSAKKEVEAYIQRLTQLARAAGMHLIVATQRPSVDVITGVIKSNIPSRIAFKVASAVDSKTILDGSGADKLLGMGDMIMKAAGVKGVDINTPLRIQGAFVKDDEVEKIVNFIKVDDGNYDESVISEIEKAAVSAESDDDDSSDSGAGEDELTNEVIEFLVKKGKASIGLVQRRFRIGYNRAARIIEDLEERGIVGPDNGTKGRAVYMDKAELYDRKSRYEDM